MNAEHVLVLQVWPVGHPEESVQGFLLTEQREQSELVLHDAPSGQALHCLETWQPLDASFEQVPQSLLEVHA